MDNINKLIAPDGRVLNVNKGERYEDFFNNYLESGNHKKTLGKKYYFHDYANQKAYMFEFMVGQAHGAAGALRRAIYKVNELTQKVDLSVTTKILSLLNDINAYINLNFIEEFVYLKDILIPFLTPTITEFTALNTALKTASPPNQAVVKAARDKELKRLFPRERARRTRTPFEVFNDYVGSHQCIIEVFAEYYERLDLFYTEINNRITYLVFRYITNMSREGQIPPDIDDASEYLIEIPEQLRSDAVILFNSILMSCDESAREAFNNGGQLTLNHTIDSIVRSNHRIIPIFSTNTMSTIMAAPIDRIARSNPFADLLIDVKTEWDAACDFLNILHHNKSLLAKLEFALNTPC